MTRRSSVHKSERFSSLFSLLSLRKLWYRYPSVISYYRTLDSAAATCKLYYGLLLASLLWCGPHRILFFLSYHICYLRLAIMLAICTLLTNAQKSDFVHVQNHVLRFFSPYIWRLPGPHLELSIAGWRIILLFYAYVLILWHWLCDPPSRFWAFCDNSFINSNGSFINWV